MLIPVLKNYLIDSKYLISLGCPPGTNISGISYSGHEPRRLGYMRLPPALPPECGKHISVFALCLPYGTDEGTRAA
jgi:hypothetical protein